MMNKNLSIGNKKFFFLNLDGIRTCAFLMVFFGHCFRWVPLQGKFEELEWISDLMTNLSNMGVNLFFVLSGFLITYMLMNEQTETGTISISKFYIRRILRIWPLYYIVVAVGFIVVFFVFKLLPMNLLTFRGTMFYAFFLVNFEHIYYNLTHTLISVLWSVSVEEQFYLCWPLLLAFTKRQYYPLLFAVLIAASIMFRINTSVTSYRIMHYHTLAIAIYLLIGGLGAWLVYTKRKFLDLITEIPKYTIVIVYVSLAFIASIHKTYLADYEALICLFYAPAFLFVVLEQNYAKHSFYKMSRIWALDFLGKYTYTLYCTHFFSIFAVCFIHIHFLKLPDDNLFLYSLEWVIAAFLCISSAILIYRYYESYFLKLKHKFDPLQKKVI